jgi:hypothetical protein
MRSCQRQQELIAETQSHLLRLSELSRAQAEALIHGSENLVMEIDQQIETTLGEKERALGALKEHRREHGC